MALCWDCNAAFHSCWNRARGRTASVAGGFIVGFLLILRPDVGLLTRTTTLTIWHPPRHSHTLWNADCAVTCHRPTAKKSHQCRSRLFPRRFSRCGATASGARYRCPCARVLVRSPARPTAAWYVRSCPRAGSQRVSAMEFHSSSRPGGITGCSSSQGQTRRKGTGAWGAVIPSW